MPSRWVCWLIIASWLASMSWLFYREIWPWLQPNIPPPYIIDLVDEARREHQPKNHWNVYLERDRPIPRLTHTRAATMLALLGVGPALQPASAGVAVNLYSLTHQQRGFVATTWVDYRDKTDDFAFTMELKPPSLGSTRRLDLGTVQLELMNSRFCVNRMGQLTEMDVDFRFDASLLSVPLRGAGVEMHGKVVEDWFRATYKVTLPKLLLLQGGMPQVLEGETKPVKLSQNGSILLPLHPVNRIRGLRLGQRWRMPLVNPLEEVLAQSSLLPVSQKEPRFLNAQVLPNLQLLPDTEEAVRCLVIEYEDEELQPRTWVQETTGLVLRQEAAGGGQRLIMQRDPIPNEK